MLDRSRTLRRGLRIPLELPIHIYGHGADQQPFFVEGRTRMVSERGALISVAAELRTGQNLVLTNPKTEEEIHCCVVFTEPGPAEATSVGIEFICTSPKFWGVALSASDWDDTCKRLESVSSTRTPHNS